MIFMVLCLLLANERIQYCQKIVTAAAADDDDAVNYRESSWGLYS